MAGVRFGGFFAALGEWCAARPGRVLGAWLAIAALALAFTGDLPTKLKGGVGNVPGSGSWQVERALARDFDSPFAQLLLVTVQGRDLAGERKAAVARELARVLASRPGIRKVREWPTAPHEPVILAVGLDSRSLEESERLVGPVRAAVTRWIGERKKRDGAGPRDLSALVTGQAAFGVDLNAFASQETAAGEKRVLPLTLLALLLAFGALGAAMAPMVAGAAAVLVAMGLIRLVAEFMPLSVYASSIASMLGLGLGIDYALFVVGRIREEGLDVRRAMRHCAPFIATSAGAVLVGLAAMATVPVQDLVGLGVGGAIVAFTSAAAGLTLLPALAVKLGPWLDSPRLMYSFLGSQRRVRRWQERARWVVGNRHVMLLGAVGILVALSLPARHIELGFPEIDQLPRQMETMRGLQVLSGLDLAGALTPVNILVEAGEGEKILTPSRIVGLARAVEYLREDSRVQEVRSVADFRHGARQLASAALLGQRPESLLPQEGRWLVSRDGRSTVVQLVLRSDASGQDREAVDTRIRDCDWNAFPGLEGVRVHVGGLTALNRDLEDTAVAALPRVVGLVALATFVVLFLATRSLLIPLKAVAANLLTVTAALGATLALFRSDWGARLLGLDGPMTNVTPGIPILVFCVVFGLSMDYEVFLLSRIMEAHERGDPDDRAVVRGLGATGGVITSAAAIMAIVFGGFALTDLVVVQMLGVSLALGVLLDATVVRLLLVPALMVMLGRYNWYPGRASVAAPAAGIPAPERGSRP